MASRYAVMATRYAHEPETSATCAGIAARLERQAAEAVGELASVGEVELLEALERGVGA